MLSSIHVQASINRLVISILDISHEFGHLIMATLQNNVGYVKKFLSNKIDSRILNFQDVSGSTALMYAISGYSRAITDAIIRYDQKFDEVNFFLVNEFNNDAIKLGIPRKNKNLIEYIFNKQQIILQANDVLKNTIKTNALIKLILEYLVVGYRDDIQIIDQETIKKMDNVCVIQ